MLSFGCASVSKPRQATARVLRAPEVTALPGMTTFRYIVGGDGFTGALTRVRSAELEEWGALMFVFNFLCEGRSPCLLHWLPVTPRSRRLATESEEVPAALALPR
jgi:hypothetical protein